VDKGVVALPGTDGETETQGIDDLGKRCACFFFFFLLFVFVLRSSLSGVGCCVGFHRWDWGCAGRRSRPP
jgi:hypothetical protein